MASDPISLEFLKWLWGLLSIPLYFLFNKVSDNHKNLSDHKLYAANTFVKNESLKEMEHRILDAISGVKDDLKNKADK
tara:strand:+ start:91 stop:324 length:234 start_codon:yes stop_codon:yes gene_type:complete